LSGSEGLLGSGNTADLQHRADQEKQNSTKEIGCDASEGLATYSTLLKTDTEHAVHSLIFIKMQVS
jgi:hypothetical protein